jgi:integrase
MQAEPDWVAITKASKLLIHGDLARRAVQSAKQIHMQYSCSLLEIMTKEELIKTGFTKSSNDLRGLKLLGANTSEIEKDQLEYATFTKEYKSRFSRNNIQRTYDNYYKPLRVKYPLHRLVDGSITRNEFLNWLHKLQSVRGSVDTIANVLSCMKIHPTYRELLLENFSVSGDLSVFVDAYREKFRQVMPKGTKAAATDNLTPYYNSLIMKTSLNSVPTLNYDDADTYCRDSHKDVLTIHRIVALDAFGSPHAEQLYRNLELEKKVHYRYQEVSKTMSMRVHKRDFVDVVGRLGGLDDLPLVPDMTPSNLAMVITESRNSIFAFRFVSSLLKNKQDTMNTLAALIPPYVMGMTITQAFRQSSPWRDSLVKDILNKHQLRVETNSAYVDSVMNKLEYTSVTILKFIEKFVQSRAPQGTDPIRWFLTTCTLENAREYILAYAQAANCDNTRVKNSLEEHHAKHAVVEILTFFKTSVNHIVPCSDSVHSVTSREIIDQVENQRVVADMSTRRTFLDSEISAILELTSEDSITTLMVTIMREIGLRPGAICNLQYRDIVDDTHQPKHHCSVLEKGKKYRHFVTGPNLKRVIARAVAHLRSSIQYTTGREFWFSTQQDMSAPLPHTTLLSRLKRLALDAGITEVNFHPHAFRHTIVGKLMDSGNSSEAVSKFMGHASTDTTMRYYFVKTIDQLTEDLKNPFVQIIATDEEIKEERDDEIIRLEAKLDATLKILGVYNAHINTMTNRGSNDVIELQANIFTEIPQLEKLMRGIEDSVSGETSTTSNTTMSSKYESSVCDFI